MSLPNNSLSLTPQPAAFLSPDSLVSSRLVDRERGGIALNDPSQGLNVRDWSAYLVGNDITVAVESGPSSVIITRPNVETLSLAFDQNMRATIAYTQAGVSKLWWFDTNAGMMVDTTFAGATYPRLCMDDKRTLEVGASDIILAYLRDGGLYYRQQRDRFQIERLLQSGIASYLRLRNIGMHAGNRLQFELS